MVHIYPVRSGKNLSAGWRPIRAEDLTIRDSLSGRRRPIHSHGHPPPAEWRFVHKQCLMVIGKDAIRAEKSASWKNAAERLWDLGNGVMFTDGTAAHSCRSNVPLIGYKGCYQHLSSVAIRGSQFPKWGK